MDDKLLKFMMDQFNRLDKKIESEILEFKNGAYDKLDAIAKEVLAMRAEQAAHRIKKNGQY